MVKEVQYTSIRRVLDDLMDHPMLADLTIEQVVRYTLKFISLHGYTKLYEEKETEVDIHEFRGTLPCDLVSIRQVMDCRTGLCLRSMAGTFMPDNKLTRRVNYGEFTFKTQNRIIYTSFPEGKVKIAYKAIPIDEDGFPLIIDNETYLEALEGFIKKKVFGIKFDKGDISPGVLQNAQQEYAWNAKLLQEEFNTPSPSEMETISNIWNTLIPQMRHFEQGFRALGNKEIIRNH